MNILKDKLQTYNITKMTIPNFDDTIYFKVINKCDMGEEEDDCWHITSHDPYPRIIHKGKKIRLNRLFLYWATDEIGAEACHKCNNTHCINPNHLYWGTKSDNMRDRAISGNAPKQKLNVKDVQMIKTLKKDIGLGTPQIANIFDVSRQHIYKIINGSRWNYI
jgi:hypothetical protein